MSNTLARRILGSTMVSVCLVASAWGSETAESAALATARKVAKGISGVKEVHNYIVVSD